MKNITRIAFAAPLALALAACGGNDAEETATADAGTEAAAPAALDSYPAIGAEARTAVAFDGTYTNTAADGTTSSITLNSADDSYTMTDAGGVESAGNYNWYSDNSRILIKSGDDTTVFGVADGVIYKMENADAPMTAVGAENAYVRN
ncbi:hypothetical protein [Altererythrobacter sp. ZODW24]|uniref:hypothetical protein n=1 Tax=Altererythrobacter sp. ZODW24 TaxID=2185142 RepID=UPI000DF758BE|nr:hypothetical protein [Altererythrobacter sp. ZODW24]